MVNTYKLSDQWQCDKFYSAGGRFRGGRGHDPFVGRTIKIRAGPFKGYRGRVKEVTGTLVRVELDSQMKVVTGDLIIHNPLPLHQHQLFNVAVYINSCSY